MYDPMVGMGSSRILSYTSWADVPMNLRNKRYNAMTMRLPGMSIVSLRKMYTGITWVKRMKSDTGTPIFSFKIRNAMVPNEFRIKIRRGETGERPMSRRTERANPHHENM